MLSMKSWLRCYEEEEHEHENSGNCHWIYQYSTGYPI